MKVFLDVKDIKFLFSEENCVVLSDWEGTAATINKHDDGSYYMVRRQEYEPCTNNIDVQHLVDVVLSEGVVLSPTDYNRLFDEWVKDK